MSRHIELDDETIYWTAQHDWTRIHDDDGRVEYGVGIFLPPLIQLRQMATQVAQGELSHVRYLAEEGDTEQSRADWRDLTGWDHPYVHQAKDFITLEVTSKINWTGHLMWWIYAREPGTDGAFSSGPYMDPSPALAWFIATCWEYHKEWMTEQLQVTGGLA